ncbi:hypothetical protein M758_4G076400, partial [Ceratodon purpureus]
MLNHLKRKTSNYLSLDWQCFFAAHAFSVPQLRPKNEPHTSQKSLRTSTLTLRKKTLPLHLTNATPLPEALQLRSAHHRNTSPTLNSRVPTLNLEPVTLSQLTTLKKVIRSGRTDNTLLTPQLLHAQSPTRSFH